MKKKELNEEIFKELLCYRVENAMNLRLKHVDMRNQTIVSDAVKVPFMLHKNPKIIFIEMNLPEQTRSAILAKCLCSFLGNRIWDTMLLGAIVSVEPKDIEVTLDCLLGKYF